MGKKEEEKKPKKSGCLKPLSFLLFLLIAALGAGVYFTFEPQDLSDIDGYREEPAAIPPELEPEEEPGFRAEGSSSSSNFSSSASRCLQTIKELCLSM